MCSDTRVFTRVPSRLTAVFAQPLFSDTPVAVAVRGFVNFVAQPRLLSLILNSLHFLRLTAIILHFRKPKTKEKVFFWRTT